MWIPYTDSVVVVWSDPATPDEEIGVHCEFDEEEALVLPRTLLRTVCPEIPEEDLKALSFTQIRDELIRKNPLDPEHIKKVLGM